MILLGDIHGDWEYLQKVISQNPKQTIFCLGEFGYWPKYKELPEVKNKVYFIDGNHEDFWSLKDNGYLNANFPQEIHNNIFYVPRGTLFELEGKNIFCCGGGESIDKQHRTLGENWFPEEGINYTNIFKSITIIENAEEIDYIFTHVAPSKFKIETEINLLPIPKSASENALNEILNLILDLEKPIEKWYFAHYHNNAESIFQEFVPWRCLGIGETINV